MGFIKKLNLSVEFIQNQIHGFAPKFGIVLGTGLGKLAEEIEVKHEIPYSEIPHFPFSTVKGHSGKLVFGHLDGKPVVAMSGRFHYYEGYSMKKATFPIRVLKLLGIEMLIVSNAAGSLNAEIGVGGIVIIRDHINLLPDHPLRGKNHEELGIRFPDMMKAYDKELVEKGLEIAKANDIECIAGVYCAVQGPTLETPAEYRYLHVIGGDVVGMSTVPEVIVCKHMNLKVFALSVSTDIGYPTELIQETTHEDVIRAANEAEPRLSVIVKGVIDFYNRKYILNV
jgi:purine-nucleoside phosphorylase